MDEPLFERIPRLERSVRFWRATALILAAILLSTVPPLIYFGAACQAQLAAVQEAMQADFAARQQAEAAMRLADQALEEAKK